MKASGKRQNRGSGNNFNFKDSAPEEIIAASTMGAYERLSGSCIGRNAATEVKLFHRLHLNLDITYPVLIDIRM